MKRLILVMLFNTLLLAGFAQKGDGEGARTSANQPLAVTGVFNQDTPDTMNLDEDTLAYKAAGEDEVEKAGPEYFFSPIYPNPAHHEAKLDYTLSGQAGNTTFVVYDLLGAKIKEIEITESTGSLRLNTSGFTEGIYFYSLLIDNESILTQKLIIKH